jgi:hydroxyacylglutathione hydrolase
MSTPATDLVIETLTVGPLATNAYLVGDPATRDAVVIDPGWEGERIVQRLRGGGWRLRAVWLTHAHFDHVGAVDAVVGSVGPVPVHLHAADRVIYQAAAESARTWAGVLLDGPHTPTEDIAHGATLSAGSLRAAARHLPGHAPGHMVFVLEGADAVVAGDTLMRGGVGRWDLPGGDRDVLVTGIRRELLSLPAATTVLPGHGPPTTVGHEARTNPYLT